MPPGLLAPQRDLPFFYWFKRGVSSISHLPFSLHKRLNSLGWPERQLTHAGEESEREKCKDGPLWSFLQGARHPPTLSKSPRPKGPGTHYAPRQHLPHLLAGRAGPARPGTYFPNAVLAEVFVVAENDNFVGHGRTDAEPALNLKSS